MNSFNQSAAVFLSLLNSNFPKIPVIGPILEINAMSSSRACGSAGYNAGEGNSSFRKFAISRLSTTTLEPVSRAGTFPGIKIEL